jgi:N6-adenosine-specific RNA methylase IME4
MHELDRPDVNGPDLVPLKAPYQLFDPLRPDEYAALEADTRKRGVQVPIDKDEAGNILDGHHRQEIADRLGLPCPARVLHFATEPEKREHVIKLNLARRHMDAVRWGRAFKRLLEERGVKTGQGSRNDMTTSATVAEVAAELGAPLRTAERRLAQARKYDALPVEEKAAVDAGEKSVREALRGAVRAAVRHEQEQTQATQRGEGCTVEDLNALVARGERFGCIYADPPWPYNNQATRAATSNHYATMSLEDITALPVADLAADNAHLHLWTTNAFLSEAINLIGAWGFTYKTNFVWVKPDMGVGNYWRGAHELLLLGVRGACPFQDHALKSWGEFKRGRHSSKPEQVRLLLERASPGPRLELFGRQAAAGWTVWGDQVERGLFAAQTA